MRSNNGEEADLSLLLFLPKTMDSEDDMDSDDIMECLCEIPDEIEIPEGMTDMDDISDYLSDLTGFCHDGFTIIDKILFLNI